MTGNLIGEKFDQYVFDQINQRQILYGKGYKGRASSNLTPDNQILINNNSSFLKLASGINLFQPKAEVTKDDLEEGVLEDERSYQGRGSYTVDNEAIKKNAEILSDINEQIKENNKLQSKAAKTKLNRLGLSPSDVRRLGQGNILAKSAVLFAGMSSLEKGVLKQRKGISESLNTWNTDSVYGLGGKKFGKQPMPGIISAEIKCVNRGSIRSATIQLKAFNQFQFDLLELLYLRLGYTMLLEWGHINYIDRNSKKQTVGTTLTENLFFENQDRDQNEVLEKIQAQRQDYEGNVDAFFGRVTNFSWKFAPDGTYDITLELYTLGDVVESLSINVPSSSPATFTGTEEQKKQSKIGGYTVLDKWMDSYMAEYSDEAVTGGGRYINLLALNTNLGQNQYSNTYSYKNKDGWDGDNKYYCTFGELLNKIVEYCIPLVVGKTTYPMVNFDFDNTLNIVSAQPNQISYDLETCFIKPNPFFNIPDANIYVNPLGFLGKGDSRVKEYFVLSKIQKTDIYYGKLMNCYINFKFIKKQLKSNIGKDGKLTLYKFLTGLCDGVNSALGDVNMIQPIIKNGNTIVFVDQVQPKGNDQILKSLIPSIPKIKEHPFELYGFNKDKSNFVNSFSFESKIDSNLATSLAIGATAGNSQTSMVDGTAFSSWNTGLQDRFSKEIIPPTTIIDTEALSKKQEEIEDEELEKLFNGDGTTWYNDILRAEDTRSGTLPKTGFYFPRSTFTEFKSLYKQWLIENPTKQTKEGFLAEPKENNYATYLAKNLSGTIVKAGVNFGSNDATYLNISNKDNYTQLKQAFKNYIQKRDEKIFRVTNTASQREGFIPLNLSIDMLGLSGMKIYQKLPIVTRFLPSQYSGVSDTIDFIIESVDHTISSNKWDTKVNTLSIPPSATTDVQIIDDSLFTFLDIPKDETFAQYVNRVAWSACFISYLAKSTGVKFPYKSAHWAYCESARAGTVYSNNRNNKTTSTAGWSAFDPRAGFNKNSTILQTQDLSYELFNYGKTVYYPNSIPDVKDTFRGVRVGDIIVSNRDNNLDFTTTPYSGFTHGDIITEINGNTVTVVGGNVSSKVRTSTYQISKSIIETSGDRTSKYLTDGAIIGKRSTASSDADTIFCALRANNEVDALKMVAKAKEELKKWTDNGWVESNSASFPSLDSYYDSVDMRRPDLVSVSSSSEPTT